MSKVKVLFYDVETSPIEGGVWQGYDARLLYTTRYRELLSIAWKWEGSDKVYFDSRKGEATDKRLTQAALRLLDEADLSVAHNGNQFDKKIIKTRGAVHKLKPCKILTTVDTYLASRSYFGFTSNSLKDLCEQLDIGKKTPHHGINLWRGCMDNDPAAWRLMERYNKNDVVLLEGLYQRLRPWVENHPNMARMLDPTRKLEAVCTSCEGTNTKRNGYRGNMRRLECKDCGKHYLFPIGRTK